jgi:methyl-accepting chemotaxis protein
MEILESFSTLTWTFIGVIGVLLLYFHGPVYSAHTANYTPSILTSIGIFGTFLGVALGLNEFDTGSIQSSVPALLEGLKTAFWTSIAGLLGALTIKFRYAVASMRVRAHRESKQTATMDDLAWHLERISNHLATEEAEPVSELLRQQHDARMVQDKRLENTIRNYQADMTEANQQALQQAIGHVMREFNTRIEEQYGENFKQLNQAVGQMIVWQNEHRESIEALVESNRQSAESAKLGAESFERLIQQTRSFTSVAEDMEALLSTLQTQSENLREYLSTFSNLVVDAQQGLPQLETRILQLTEGMQQLVETQGQQMRSLLEGSATDIRDTVKQVSEVLLEGTERAQQSMGSQLTQLLERNDQQLKQMDHALEDELNRSMKSFGYQLTALSEKFVNDYTPLTDKLHDLVRLAEQSK